MNADVLFLSSETYFDPLLTFECLLPVLLHVPYVIHKKWYCERGEKL